VRGRRLRVSCCDRGDDRKNTAHRQNSQHSVLRLFQASPPCSEGCPSKSVSQSCGTGSQVASAEARGTRIRAAFGCLGWRWIGRSTHPPGSRFGTPPFPLRNQQLNQANPTACTRGLNPNRVLKDTFQYTSNRVAFCMATEKAETDRVPVTLALSTITYLEKLVRQGTHGTSLPGVARKLIAGGISLPIKYGAL